MRLISICIATLLLAGCAGSGGSGSFGSFGGPVARPKTIVVTDFVFASEVVPIDRGFTARLERKIGSFPTFERKQRTAERVNDEIVASIVATLREAGFDAQPGSGDSITLKDETIVVSGRLRANDAGNATKKDQIDIGGGRSGVVADMTVSRFAFGGKKQLTAFAAEAGSGRSAAVTGKLAAAQNAEIAEALVAEKAAPEKLSPDVEAQTRRLGRTVGEKFVAYAKEQGWLEKTGAVEAAPEERVKLPEPKPEKKADKKPAKPPQADPQDKPED